MMSEEDKRKAKRHRNLMQEVRRHIRAGKKVSRHRLDMLREYETTSEVASKALRKPYDRVTSAVASDEEYTRLCSQGETVATPPAPSRAEVAAAFGVGAVKSSRERVRKYHCKDCGEILDSLTAGEAHMQQMHPGELQGLDVVEESQAPDPQPKAAPTPAEAASGPSTGPAAGASPKQDAPKPKATGTKPPRANVRPPMDIDCKALAQSATQALAVWSNAITQKGGVGLPEVYFGIFEACTKDILEELQAKGYDFARWMRYPTVAAGPVWLGLQSAKVKRSERERHHQEQGAAPRPRQADSPQSTPRNGAAPTTSQPQQQPQTPPAPGGSEIPKGTI